MGRRESGHRVVGVGVGGGGGGGGGGGDDGLEPRVGEWAWGRRFAGK